MHNSPEYTVRVLDHMTGWRIICRCPDCVKANDERMRAARSLPRHGTLNRWGGLGTGRPAVYRRYP